MFRNLIPPLDARFHLVAPDYPGFGHSEFPDPGQFEYSFESIASLLDAFVEALGLNEYALYVQDYGAPLGFRLALLHPERIRALVIQNGNAYEEGLSPDWDPLKAYWNQRTPENRERLRRWLNPEGIRLQYAAGLPDRLIPFLDPDSWMLDWSSIQRPGNIEMHLDLFADYRRNIELYPEFQRFFRERQPPALIVWGRHDPFFTIAGAEAYLRDLKDAELHLLDAGHFALETHAAFIAARMEQFLSRIA